MSGARGFLLDTNLCTGCGACVVACAVENELPWGTSWRQVETFNPLHFPGLPTYHLSLACNHCAEAPCMEHCPALAYTRDPCTGAVLLHEDRCMGCRYCTWACPYDAPRFRPERGVVEKCTFCQPRQVEGRAPACVQQCPTGALRYGPLSDLPGTPTVAGFPDTPARPSIRFVPPRTGMEVAAGPTPAAATASDPPSTTASGAGPGASVTLRSEWPLLLFTLLAAFLAGTVPTAAGRAALGPAGFVALAAAAAAISTAHLGRPLRAWRAVRNLRRSWLSREIASFGLFVPAGLASFFTDAPAAAALAALPGALLVLSMDRVYTVTATAGVTRHSAATLPTAVAVAGVWSGIAWLWAPALALPSALFLERWLRRYRGTRGGAGLLAVRLGAGLAVPAVLLAAGAGPLPALLSLAAGTAVDRVLFYRELELTSPRRSVAEALSRAARAGPAPDRPPQPSRSTPPAAPGPTGPAA